MAVKELMQCIVLLMMGVSSLVLGLNNYVIGMLGLMLIMGLIVYSAYLGYHNTEFGKYGMLLPVLAFIAYYVVGTLFKSSADLFLVIWVAVMLYFAYTYHGEMRNTIHG